MILDVEGSLVLALLSLVYRGSANLHPARHSDLRDLIAMLELKVLFTSDPSTPTSPLPPSLSSPPPRTTPIQPPATSPSPSSRGRRGGPGSMQRRQPPAKRAREESGEEARRVRERREVEEDLPTAHVSMINATRSLAPDALAQCTVSGCDALITKEQINNHFLVHQRGGKAEVVVEERVEREGREGDIQAKLRSLLPDSSDEEEEDEAVTSPFRKSSAPSRPPSVSSRPPSRSPAPSPAPPRSPMAGPSLQVGRVDAPGSPHFLQVKSPDQLFHQPPKVQPAAWDSQVGPYNS